MVIKYTHYISKYFWFLIFFLVFFSLVYYFLKLIFGESYKTQQILKLKAERYNNFSSGQFVHVAQQMQNNNSEAFLTPLQFSRPCRDNFLVEISDKLWDNTAFPIAWLVLISALTLTIFISTKFPDLGEIPLQLVKEYILFAKSSGPLTNAEKWDFLLAYFEAGTWIFVVLDAAEKISYFVMLRATLQVCSRYYTGEYWNVILALSEIAPLPFGCISLSLKG